MDGASRLCKYPLVKVRKDMGFQEYADYKKNWYIFNRILAYNYDIRAAGLNTFYIFASNAELNSYILGQYAHIASYPAAAALGIFNNIHF